MNEYHNGHDLSVIPCPEPSPCPRPCPSPCPPNDDNPCNCDTVKGPPSNPLIPHTNEFRPFSFESLAHTPTLPAAETTSILGETGR